MGHASERHDIHSYETHDAQWVGFRQPVLLEARNRAGESLTDDAYARVNAAREELFGQPPAFHHPTGELVDQDDLVVLDDVVRVALVELMRAQCLVDVVDEVDVVEGFRPRNIRRKAYAYMVNASLRVIWHTIYA